MSVKVSVLISTLNADRYLRDAIDSLLSQTFKDFEILVLDAGSTDNTLDILRGYEGCKLRFYIKAGLGLGAALNFLIHEANGDYLARMDSDDIALPSRFQEQVDFLDSNPEVCLLGTQIDFLIDGKTIPRTPYPVSHKSIYSDLRAGIFSLGHPAVMFRAQTAKSVGGYSESGIGEDLGFFLKMGSEGQLANIDKTLLHYRISNSSITSTRYDEAQVSYAYTLYKYNNPDFQLDLEEFKKIHIKHRLFRRFTNKLKKYSDYYFKLHLVNYNYSRIWAMFFLLMASILQPQAALRHIKRRFKKLLSAIGTL